MTNTKYKTIRVSGVSLKVGTVCYNGGQIVKIEQPVNQGIVVTFRDGRFSEFGYNERVRIYPSL